MREAFIIYANNSCHGNATFDCCCHQDMAANVNSKHRWKWTKFRFSFIRHKRNFKTLNEMSKHSMKLCLKIRFTKWNIFRNFARCFAQSGEILHLSMLSCWGGRLGKGGGFELWSSFQFKCRTAGKLTMVKRVQILRPRDISVVQKNAHSPSI